MEEGLEIVRAVRQRQDGYKRNPFDEVECGRHYARSMASWALIPALSGFSWDGRTGRMRLDPKIHADDFRCFFSTGKAWGTCRQRRDENGDVKQEFAVIYQPGP